MLKITRYLEKVDFQDKEFIGTIALRNEEITLLDGSKMALGIDDGHWVLVYQESAHGRIKVFKYDQHEDKMMVDQKSGGAEDVKIFKKYLKCFFSQVNVEDLVTLLPPQG